MLSDLVAYVVLPQGPVVDIHHPQPLLDHQARIWIWSVGIDHCQPSIWYHARCNVSVDLVYHCRHLQRSECVLELASNRRRAILEGQFAKTRRDIF